MSNDVNITIFTHEIHKCYITKHSGNTLNCALDNQDKLKYFEEKFLQHKNWKQIKAD